MVGQEGNQKEYPITGRIKFSPDIPLHSLRFTIGRGIPRSPFQIRTERNTKYVNNIPGGGNPVPGLIAANIVPAAMGR